MRYKEESEEVRVLEHHVFFELETSELPPGPGIPPAVGTQRIVCKKGPNERAFTLTENLLALLTKNVLDQGDENAMKDYTNMLGFCVGKELLNIYNMNNNNPIRKRIYDELRQSPKYEKVTKSLKVFSQTKEERAAERKKNKQEKQRFGTGYKQIAKTHTIIIPPDCNEQIRRLAVLIGSANASNTNPDILREGSAILDELYKSKTIDKLRYKVLWHKLHSTQVRT